MSAGEHPNAKPDALYEAPPMPPLTLRRGKVRDIFELADDTLALVATDRVSAFDRVLGAIPHKGQILNRMSAWWFGAIDGKIPHAFLDQPTPNVTRMRRCKPLPVEFVMRGYMTGVTSTSVWTHYKNGSRTFCGHALPEGLTFNEALPAPMLTPSTKAPVGSHDASLSREALIEAGVIDAAVFDEAALYSHALFALGQAHCHSQGVLLVDTKYEFGVDDAGSICLIDEIHTPDSSRFWRADDYEAARAEGRQPEHLDKEFLRLALNAQGFTGEGPSPPLDATLTQACEARYAEAFERVTGQAFRPEPQAQSLLKEWLHTQRP